MKQDPAAKRKTKKTRMERAVNLAAPPPELPDEVLEEKIFTKFSLDELLDLRQTCKQWNRVVLGHRNLLGATNLRQCVVQTYRTKPRSQAPEAPPPSPLAPSASPDAQDGEPQRIHDDDDDDDDHGHDGHAHAHAQEQQQQQLEEDQRLIEQILAEDAAAAAAACEGGFPGCLIVAHRAVRADDDWYYGVTPWTEDPDLRDRGFHEVEFAGAEGPFLLHRATRKEEDVDDGRGGAWVVQNPLGMTYHILPPVPDLEEARDHLVHSAVRLIPGSPDADHAARANGVFNYRALAVTVATARRGDEGSWVCAHLYTSATDGWELVDWTQMAGDVWRVRPHCFYGTTLVCSFRPERQDLCETGRLWALDTARRKWTEMCTDGMQARNSLVSYRCVVCSGRLLAVARYDAKAGNQELEVPEVSVFEYLEEGEWRKLSDMPGKYAVRFKGLLASGRDQYAVSSPFVYFGGLEIRSQRSSITALVFDVSNDEWRTTSSMRLPSNVFEQELEPSRFVSMAPNRDAVP